MAKGKTSISGRLVCGIMAFLLSLMLTVAVLLPALYFMLLSPGAFVRTFKASDYYQTLLDYGITQATGTLRPTGFSEEILEGVFTVEDVQKIVDGKVRGTLTDEDMELLASGLQDKLLENMYAYMDANDIPRDIISTEGLENIAATVTANIEEYASFPLINRIRSYFSLYSTLAVIGVVVCLGLSVLLSKLIHSLSIWKHVYYRNLAFSTGGAGTMLIVLPGILLAWGGFRRVNIATAYLSEFIHTLVTNVLWVLVACGAVMLIITVALVLLSEKDRKKVSGRRRRREPGALADGLPEL